MRLATQRGRRPGRLAVLCALALALLTRSAPAQIATTTTTLPSGITFHQAGYGLGGQWTGSSLGIPNALAGLVFAPSGNPLYVVGGVGSGTTRLYAVTVTRNNLTQEITNLTGPATIIFTGTLAELDAGLAFGRNGTFFYSYHPALRFAERPGGVAGTPTVFTPPAAMVEGVGALTFNPHAARVDPSTGFGRMLLGNGFSDLREVLLTPTAGNPNLFQPGATAPRYVQTDAPIGGMGQARFLAAPLQGDLMYAAYGDGQLRVIDIDPTTGLPVDEGTGVPTLGTTNPIDTAFASGFGSEEFAGPFGLAIDPLTNDVFVTTQDGIPANRIFKIDGFSSVVSTTTTLQTTSTSSSTSTTTSTSSSSTTSTSTSSSTSSSSSSSTSSTSSSSTTSSTSSTTSSSTSSSTSSTSTSTSTSTSSSSTSSTSSTSSSTSSTSTSTSTSTSSSSTSSTSSTTSSSTSSSTSSTTSTSLPGQTTTTSTSVTTTTSTTESSTSTTSTSVTTTTSTTESSTSSSTSSTTSTSLPGQTTTTSTITTTSTTESSTSTTSTSVTTTTSTTESSTSSSTSSTTSTSLPGQTTTTSTITTTSTTESSTTSTSVTTTTSTTESSTSSSTSSTTSTSLPGQTTTTSTITTTSTTESSTTSTSSTTDTTTLSTITTSTIPGSTTTTSTLPEGVEVCGNCLDDDANGLADYDDPACCSGIDPGTMVVGSVRIRATAIDSKFRLRARIEGLVVDDLSQSSLALVLQLSNPLRVDPLLCARIDPEHFRTSRDQLRFRDRRGEITTAKGFTSMQLRRTPKGRVKLAAGGKHVAFLAGGLQQLRLTAAVQDTGQIGAPTHCVSALVPER